MRTMFAALALAHDQTVSTERLIDAMWGGSGGPNAAHALHVHATRLRKVLPTGMALSGEPGGYRLCLGEYVVDAERFAQLGAAGEAAFVAGDRDRETATRSLTEALDLWRGTPLTGVSDEPFGAEVRRWEEQRRLVEEELVEVGLAEDRHRELVPEVEALVEAAPLRERRWGQLMRVLYSSGRQADALARYDRVRALLADELGIDPGPELQDLQLRILRRDASIGPMESAPAPATRYATGASGRVAYQVVGGGPSTLVFLPGFSANLELRWEEPALARLFRQLAEFARVVILDRPGTGLSARAPGIPDLECQIDDVLAVIEAADVDSATVAGVYDGGAVALLCAAAHPRRFAQVVTYATFPAWSMLSDAGIRMLESMTDDVQGNDVARLVETLAPSRVGDDGFTAWLGRYLRMGSGVDGADTIVDQYRRIDIRDVLADVSVPVLALSRADDRVVPADCARHIASSVPHGRAEFFPGADSLIWAGDVDPIAAEIAEFLS